MNKKFLAIGGVILALLIVGGIFAYNQFTKPAADTQTNNKKKIAEPLNVIPVAERPYMQISPVADGRNIQIIVKEVNKPAESVDYELEYQAGTLLQGIFGTLQLSNLPASVTELMGSCSAGGACTYHEDVKGGTLLTRFSGPENYALKSDWKYIDNSTRETEFASKDSKFQLTSASLANQRYLVIFNTAGYPEGLEGNPVSDPYSLAVSSALSGKGTLTMRANEDGELKIMGWNGSEWINFGGEVSAEDSKMISAEVDLVELYIVVK